jgi:hypothetical protein
VTISLVDDQARRSLATTAVLPATTSDAEVIADDALGNVIGNCGKTEPVFVTHASRTGGGNYLREGKATKRDIPGRQELGSDADRDGSSSNTG